MIVFPLRSWARNTQGLKKDQSSRTFPWEFRSFFSQQKETQSHVSSRSSVLPQKSAKRSTTPACFFLSLSLLSLVSLSKGEESLVWFTHCNKNCGSFITTSLFYPLWRFIILAKKKNDPFPQFPVHENLVGSHTDLLSVKSLFLFHRYSHFGRLFLKLLNLLTSVIVSNLHSKHPPGA